MPRNQQSRRMIRKNSEPQRILASALCRSRRRNFVRHYLFLLWPDSERLLLELARRIGGEVNLPGDRQSLLAACLSAGAGNFYRRKSRRYHPAAWDQKVFLDFFHGVFRQAAAIYDCRVLTREGAWWEAIYLPYLDWRRRHPGEIEICWQSRDFPVVDRAAVRLCRLVLSGCGYRRTWTVKQLLNSLEDSRVF